MVDLVLRGTYFVDPGVSGNAQRAAGVTKLVPERGQFIEHVKAERALAYLGATAARGWRLQGLRRVGIGCGQIKLDLWRHHRRQTQNGVLGQHVFEDAARRKLAQSAIQLLAIDAALLNAFQHFGRSHGQLSCWRGGQFPR